MTDQEFLMWIHERLCNVHKENHLVDYMHRLRFVIVNLPRDQMSVVTVPLNDIQDVQSHIKLQEKESL